MVSSTNSSFVWTDRNATITNIHAGYLAPTALDVLLNHSSRLEKEFSFEMQARSPLKTGFITRFKAATVYEATVAYNEILKPHGMGQVCDLILRDRTGPRGVAMIGRGLADVPFSTDEQSTILALRSWLLHALDQPWSDGAEITNESDDGGEEAVLLCDQQGRMLQMGPNASRMVLYAGNGRIAAGAAIAGLGDLMPETIRRVCADLAAVLSGRPAQPPRATLRTKWGTFHFRAHRLAAGTDGGGSDGQLVVVIRRATPLALRLHGRVGNLPLTPRQRQIAVMIGLGKRPETIQSELDLSPGTYRRHVEDIHVRLDVRSRSGLMAALMSGSGSPATAGSA